MSSKFEKNLLNPNNYIHRNGYFLLVYTGSQSDRLKSIEEIFKRLFHLYVINVNVLLMVGKYAQIYTYFPFTPRKCHSSDAEFHISFRGIETSSNYTIDKTIFPGKVDNMYGCGMTILTWTYAPYVKVERDDNGNFLSLHGVEGSVISYLSQLMNFTIEIIEPTIKEAGEIFPNGTITGAIEKVSLYTLLYPLWYLILWVLCI